jgi:NADPH:quinone reductase-like Zn-dependent oxidoreductase
MGHEYGGVVHAVGPGVENFEVGALVGAIGAFGGFGDALVPTSGDGLEFRDEGCATARA